MGRILSKTDPLNHTTTYTYDNASNVLTVSDPLGNVTTSAYDADNNRTSVTDPLGHTTNFTYNQNDKLITTTDPLGRTTTCGYDAENNLISVTDPLNHTTSYTYDFLNRLTSTTDANGRTETYNLDGNGNRVSKTDRNGNTTTYTYDVLNRPTGVTDALGNSGATEYDALGNKTSVTDQRGNTTSFIYDQGLRLLSATDPLDHTTSYTYDLVGNKLSATDPRGARWSYAYDDNNRLVTVTDPLGHISSTEYDSVGNAVYRTDANNVTTTFDYDSLNRLTSVTDALGHTTSYTYDDNSNLITVTNAKNQTFTATYDALNRVVQESDPLGNTNHKTYDPAGNLSSRTRPDGSEINYDYNTNNRLTSISYPDQTGVTYTYDYNGNRNSMTDPSGAISYSYDSLNRMTSVTRDVYSVGYEYDQAGNITALTYPGGLRVSYTYNGLNLPVSVSDSVYSTNISYDEAGNRIQEILPNGITVNYEYDLNGRLTLLQHANGGNIIAKAAYTLDNVGNRLSVTDELDGTTSYIYDDLYQLTRVDYPEAQSVEYTYDPASNRTSAGGVPYTYDNANHLIQVGTTPYSYDLSGNLLSVGGAVYYDYDYENRLISYSDANKIIEYTYDGDGNRLGQSVSGSVYANYEYIYNINTGIPRLLVEKDSTGNTNNYIYAGRLLSRIDPAGTVYYHQDGLGSISVITDVYGNPLNRYAYDAFGNSLSTAETVANQFRFTGEQYDANGLIYLRARYYNPATGRFLSQDTFNGKLNDPLSQNRYAYCGNNPVIYIDPTGHMKICQIDDLGRGLLESGGETIRALLATPGALWELYQAIRNHQLSLEDLAQALGDAGRDLVEPIRYVVGNSGKVIHNDPEYPTDEEVFEYGRNLGNVLQTAIGSAAAGKVIAKAAPKVARSLGIKGAGEAATDTLENMMQRVSLGRGSTGRVMPNSLNEQLAMKEVLSNPLENAMSLPLNLNDSRWLADEGWVKMQRIVITTSEGNVNIHFNYNSITGEVDDFKFVD